LSVMHGSIIQVLSKIVLARECFIAVGVGAWDMFGRRFGR
jgi:hypothetical protein